MDGFEIGDVGMREGSGLSTWVDWTVVPFMETGGQVWRVGGGRVNKKFHFGHTKFESLGDMEEMCSSRQLHLGTHQHHGEGPGPAERGQAGVPGQVVKS